MTDALLWENVAGWVILSVVLFVFAAILLLPLRVLRRRLLPWFKPHWAVRMMTTAIVAAALFYAMPRFLHWIYYKDIL